MKNSVLAVPGTLLGIFLLIGQSYSSALNRFSAVDSDGGATSLEKSSRLDLSRDMSHPISAPRFARSANEGDPSPSPKFHHLILIIPCVLGVAIAIFITVVVCYQMRKSGRNKCISNECLIWCGLKKREHSPDPPERIDRSGYEVYRPVVYADEKGVVRTRYIPASPRHQNCDESVVEMLTKSQGFRVSEWVTCEGLGACPSERSPTLQDTPTTNVTPLPTDDEISPRTEAIVHQYKTDPADTKFRYPDTTEPKGNKTIIEQITKGLENIPESENIGLNVQPGFVGVGCSGMNGTRSGNGESGLDDDVFNDEADKRAGLDIGAEEAGASRGPSDPGRKRKEAFVSSRDSSVESNHSQAGGQVSRGGRPIGELSSSGYDSEDAAPQPLDLPTKPLQSTLMHGGKQHMNGEGSCMEPPMTREPTGITSPPRSAPSECPVDNHREIHSREVVVVVKGDAHFEIQKPVNDFQVGDRKIEITHHHHHSHQANPDEVHNSFSRASPVRHTR